MTEDNPKSLQQKVWFTLQLQYARRGMENVHDIKKSDLIMSHSQSGKSTIQLRDYLTKNHRGGDNTLASSAIILESGTDDCPVQLIKKYLARLHPENPYLWQKAKQNITTSDACWYNNQKVGHNTIASMMKTISISLKLSTIYTNHCVRSTSITVLGRSFGDKDIRAVSGHRSLNALGIYKRTNENTLTSMSKHLQKCLSSGEPTPPKKFSQKISDQNMTLLKQDMSLDCDVLSQATEPMSNTDDNSIKAENIPISATIPNDIPNSKNSQLAQSLTKTTVDQVDQLANTASANPGKLFGQLLSSGGPIMNNPQFNNCSISFNVHFLK